MKKYITFAPWLFGSIIAVVGCSGDHEPRISVAKRLQWDEIRYNPQGDLTIALRPKPGTAAKESGELIRNGVFVFSLSCAVISARLGGPIDPPLVSFNVSEKSVIAVFVEIPESDLTKAVELGFVAMSQDELGRVMPRGDCSMFEE